MGRPFVRKGEFGDGLDGEPTRSVEVTDEPGGVIEVRLYGVRDAATHIDENSRDTAQDIRERLNDPEEQAGNW